MVPFELIKSRYTVDFETGIIYHSATGDPVYLREKDGYMQIRLKHKGKVHHVLAHRIVLGFYLGRWPSITDHINRVRDDNRLCNLREVTPKQNANNRVSHKSVKGIYWEKDRKRWKVRAGNTSKGRIHVGRYRLFCEAFSAWKQAQVDLGFSKYS